MSLPGGALGRRFGVRDTMIAGAVVTVLGMVLMPMAEFLPDHGQDAWLLARRTASSMG
jgi:hypothetical protein